jgi:hypothetical protein
MSGAADPFNGHVEEFRISHVQRSDGRIETTYNNMSNRSAFAVAGVEEQKTPMASRHRLQALGLTTSLVALEGRMVDLQKPASGESRFIP